MEYLLNEKIKNGQCVVDYELSDDIMEYTESFFDKIVSTKSHYVLGFIPYKIMLQVVFYATDDTLHEKLKQLFIIRLVDIDYTNFICLNLNVLFVNRIINFVTEYNLYSYLKGLYINPRTNKEYYCVNKLLEYNKFTRQIYKMIAIGFKQYIHRPEINDCFEKVFLNPTKGFGSREYIEEFIKIGIFQPVHWTKIGLYLAKQDIAPYSELVMLYIQESPKDDTRKYMIRESLKRESTFSKVLGVISSTDIEGVMQCVREDLRPRIAYELLQNDCNICMESKIELLKLTVCKFDIDDSVFGFIIELDRIERIELLTELFYIARFSGRDTTQLERFLNKNKSNEI
jgi:hypothetical protein